MKYKDISIEGVNKVLGFNILSKSKDKYTVRARHGAWLCFYINGYSYTDIGKMFGLSARTILGGVDSFEDKLKERDQQTLEIWDKLKVYEL